MRNAGLEEAQAGIKIAGRNINNLRYADDTTLMAESEEELKSLLMKVKEESEEVGLNLNVQKMNIMASGPITSWQINGETASDFIFYFTILRRLVIFYVTKFQYYIWKRLTCIFASRLFFLLFIPFSSLLSPVLIIPLHL